ncbi:Endoglucanase 11 [Hibiscus syriacus]|uniref:cellulase n=1 Tax=Hibiscus syriacus TaxID=106335 RepID=A0A6A2XC09_HIBSY|nr:Endoglucanase 11 [Hibiscus syriacus]
MEEQNHQQIPRFALLPFLFSVFTVFLATAQAFDYGDALTKSLLYFESQRSGRLPYNQRGLSWRILRRRDHVKFGLPMAFTVTMLSWGVIEFRDQIADAGELEHALEAIKWGTDYFIKAHTSPNVLWAEVGDGDTDHYCWQRPEDMTTSRRAYKIDKNNPGSDLAGETAAAMAAASIVFKKTNPHYSNLLLHHAQEVLVKETNVIFVEFGDKYRGKYDGSVGVVKRYYESQGSCFGGIGWAISEFSWDVKYAGLQVLASKLLNKAKQKRQAHILKQYRSKAEYYLCSCLNKNNATNDNIERTPGGLLYTRQWNNMQYVSTAAFLLTVYSDFLRYSNEHLQCPSGTVDHEEIISFANLKRKECIFMPYGRLQANFEKRSATNYTPEGVLQRRVNKNSNGASKKTCLPLNSGLRASISSDVTPTYRCGKNETFKVCAENGGRRVLRRPARRLEVAMVAGIWDQGPVLQSRRTGERML